jgi:hypothetical protein
LDKNSENRAEKYPDGKGNGLPDSSAGVIIEQKFQNQKGKKKNKKRKEFKI